MSIKKILSNKISHKYNFHEEIHLLFKIKYLLLQFIYNISTSKCFHVLRSIGNPAKSAIRSKFVADTYTTIRACTVQEWREKEGDAAKISLTFILGYHWSRACH